MTPERYALALIAFHAVVIAAAAFVLHRWRSTGRCAQPMASWAGAMAGDAAMLSVFVYALSLAAPFLANFDDPRRLHIGEISGRLMGQAVFAEGAVLCAALAFRHRLAAQRARTATLAVAALCLVAMYVEAYRMGPFRLRVRHHEVAAAAGGPSIRILHVTDIQTPRIGAHEERALRLGLAQSPDLIVLTGDYVQDALGEPTEARAAHDLRALLHRLRFTAPLGVFATEGDVGPPCRDVFAGTAVRCLTDESAVVSLEDGSTLKVTGLSRGRGRERDPDVLAGLLRRGPRADHHIVLSHSPDFVDRLRDDVALVLAGHTHGGQFVLPLWGPLVTASRLPRRYAADLHDFRGTPLHVSRGVGMERGFAPPVRFLCPPEVCVVDLPLAATASTARPGRRAHARGAGCRVRKGTSGTTPSLRSSG